MLEMRVRTVYHTSVAWSMGHLEMRCIFLATLLLYDQILIINYDELEKLHIFENGGNVVFSMYVGESW